MNEKTFLQQLSKGLKSLPKKEQEDILQDYKEYFTEGRKKKRTDASIAKGLGDPKRLARNLKADYHLTKAKSNASLSNLSRAVLAAFGLGVLNILIVLGPVIGLFAVFISLYAVVLALGVSGIALIAAGFAILFTGVVAGGIGLIFAGIAVLALALLLFMGVNWLLKWFLKGLAAYLQLNVKVIKGENRA